MKCRRLLLITVVTALCLSLLAGTALAGQGNGSKSKGVQVQKSSNVKINKVNNGKSSSNNNVKANNKKKGSFLDVSDNHWGCTRIRAMALQGIITGNNGYFRPSANVSNLEALTMILRTEDFDQDDLDEALENQEVPRSVPLWGKGYAALALEEGLITKDELKKMKSNQPAKRYEVAIYLGRALDIDEDDSDAELDFTDLNSIPEEAQEYLPYLVEKGYMTGYQMGWFKKFMPLQPVTRAEMAVILSKITADQADDDDIDVDIISKLKAKGKIDSLDDDELVLKTSKGTIEFSVDPDDIIVFLNNKEADYDDLEEGYKALVLTNSDEEALVIYAYSGDKDDDDDEDEDDEDKVEIEIEGIFQEIDDDEIIIKVGKSLKEYDLDEDADVEIDGDNADVDDLLPGMKVELTIEDDLVVEINAKALNSIKGKFKEADDDEITIEVDGEEYTYLLDDPDVKINGQEADLDDLTEEKEITLKFDDNEVVEITATYYTPYWNFFKK